jgi:hypothetical protein
VNRAIECGWKGHRLGNLERREDGELWLKLKPQGSPPSSYEGRVEMGQTFTWFCYKCRSGRAGSFRIQGRTGAIRMT